MFLSHVDNRGKGSASKFSHIIFIIMWLTQSDPPIKHTRNLLRRGVWMSKWRRERKGIFPAIADSFHVLRNVFWSLLSSFRLRFLFVFSTETFRFLSILNIRPLSDPCCVNNFIRSAGCLLSVHYFHFRVQTFKVDAIYIEKGDYRSWGKLEEDCLGWCWSLVSKLCFDRNRKFWLWYYYPRGGL